MNEPRERVRHSVGIEPHLSPGPWGSHSYFTQMDGEDFQSHFFELQPVVSSNKREFGIEVRFRHNWNRAFKNDPTMASEFLIDNWFLFGFESLTDGGAVFFNCPREVLLSKFVWHLPLSTVVAVQQSISIDEQVLTTCRSLKKAGYRIALDDFDSVEATERLLSVSHFLRVDFRHEGRRARANMLRRLNLTQATLIARMIDSEAMFREAASEGFGLFQGDFFSPASAEKATDNPNSETVAYTAWSKN